MRCRPRSTAKPVSADSSWLRIGPHERRLPERDDDGRHGEHGRIRRDVKCDGDPCRPERGAAESDQVEQTEAGALGPGGERVAPVAAGVWTSAMPTPSQPGCRTIRRAPSPREPPWWRPRPGDEQDDEAGRSTRLGRNRSNQRPTRGPSSAMVAGTANSTMPATETENDLPTRYSGIASNTAPRQNIWAKAARELRTNRDSVTSRMSTNGSFTRAQCQVNHTTATAPTPTVVIATQVGTSGCEISASPSIISAEPTVNATAPATSNGSFTPRYRGHGASCRRSPPAPPERAERIPTAIPRRRRQRRPSSAQRPVQSRSPTPMRRPRARAGGPRTSRRSTPSRPERMPPPPPHRVFATRSAAAATARSPSRWHIPRWPTRPRHTRAADRSDHRTIRQRHGGGKGHQETHDHEHAAAQRGIEVVEDRRQRNVDDVVTDGPDQGSGQQCGQPQRRACILIFSRPPGGSGEIRIGRLHHHHCRIGLAERRA